MSLIGINLIIQENRSAFVQFGRIIIFKSNLTMDNLNVEGVKLALKAAINVIDIWWATTPYVRIRFDRSLYDLFCTQYAAQPLLTEGKDTIKNSGIMSGFRRSPGQPNGSKIFLVELKSAIGDNHQRYLRSPEIICDLSSIAVIEDMFEVAQVLRG